MKQVLITGISGQDGAYLSRLFIEEGVQVLGILRETSSKRNLEKLSISNYIDFIELDLTDFKKVDAIINSLKPEEIYHLSSQSSVGYSFKEPYETLFYNYISTLNLLEAIKNSSVDTKFYHASSSEMFGSIGINNLPLKEKHLFHPLSPYAVSKASSHWLTVNYRETYNLFACSGILFNHESALRAEGFVIKKIIDAAFKIKEGSLEKLQLGDIEIVRDWGYAPEYVKAMKLMLQHHKPEDFIICSGYPSTLKTIVEMVFSQLELDYSEHIEIDKNLFRPNELRSIYGDNTKAKKILNWNYEITTKELVKKLIEDEKNFRKM